MAHQGRVRSWIQGLFLLAVLAAPAGTGFGQDKTAEAPAKQPTKSAVVVQGKILFNVQERVYSFSPEDRAKAISERIQRLYKDPRISIDAVRVEDSEGATDIVVEDLVIMTVTDRDALAAGRSRQELAQEYANVIRTVAKELQRDYSLKSLALGFLWTLLASIALVAVFKLLSIAFPKLYAKLDSWRGTRIQSIRIQKLELLTADRITDALIMLAQGTRIVAVIALFYFYLPLVFSFFPWTQGWAAVLFENVMRPVRLVGGAVAEYLPNVFFIGVILAVSYYAIKFVKFIFTEVRKGTLELPGFYSDWAEPTYKIVRFMIIAFTAVVVFPYLPGSRSPAFQGISLFLGLLFSLGSTSAVANIVAGMVLTYTRAFQLGDRVKIGDATGDVMEKTLLVTRVRTIKNVDISIPNAMVLSSHIINFSSTAQEHGLVLHTSVTIGYDAPWRQVHELLLAATDATQNILKDPKPFVLQTSLDDFYVTYQLNAFTDQPSVMARTYSDLHQNIQDRFNEYGVEIMSPHYERDRQVPTIVPRERWYSPPAKAPQEDAEPPKREDEKPS